MASGTWKKYQNLWLSGKLKLRKGAEILRDDQLVSITSATATITHELHGNGRVIALNLAAGIAAALPLANGSGKSLKFIVGTTFTGDGVITATGGAFFGTAVGTTDTGSVTATWNAATGNNTITLDGTTTGGYKGDIVRLTDIGAGSWQADILINQTLTEATPFSTV